MKQDTDTDSKAALPEDAATSDKYRNSLKIVNSSISGSHSTPRTELYNKRTYPSIEYMRRSILAL